MYVLYECKYEMALEISRRNSYACEWYWVMEKSIAKSEE